MRVLILALTSGEGDLPHHRLSVERQRGADVQYREFAGLPNLEAHKKLYTTIMSEKDRFDAFIKLDGDMVFREQDSAARMAQALQGGCDMVTFPVLDFVTMGPLNGVHVFSPRVRWDVEAIREPRVDPTPQAPGKLLSNRMKSWAPAYHGYFMSREQAFSFGIHRGYKAFRKHAVADPFWRALGAPHPLQIAVLCRVWSAYLKTRDPVRAAVMVGAERIRRVAKDIGPFAYKDLEPFSDVLPLALKGSARDVMAYCGPYWSSAARLWQGTHTVAFTPGIVLRRFTAASTPAA